MALYEVDLEICLEMLLPSYKQTSTEKTCFWICAGLHTDRSRSKNTHWNISFFMFQTDSLLGLYKRFAAFPDIAVNLWVLASGQHDAEHWPILSFWHNKTAKRASQTCRICLILIFSTCPASSNVGAKTNVFHNSTKCNREMIHDHVSCLWITIIPPQKAECFFYFLSQDTILIHLQSEIVPL